MPGRSSPSHRWIVPRIVTGGHPATNTVTQSGVLSANYRSQFRQLSVPVTPRAMLVEARCQTR